MLSARGKLRSILELLVEKSDFLFLSFRFNFGTKLNFSKCENWSVGALEWTRVGLQPQLETPYPVKKKFKSGRNVRNLNINEIEMRGGAYLSR